MYNHPLNKINFNSLDSAYVVEASAGTGKTWTIERLFIKALLEANSLIKKNQPIKIENILVVTFTNDATDELKERIFEQLSITINQIVLLKNKQSNFELNDLFNLYLLSRKDNFIRDIYILNRAIQNFDRASIYTIHGFCNKIIRDYQFECNVNSELELVVDKRDIIESLVVVFVRKYVINYFTSEIDIVLSNLEKMFISNDYDLTLEQKIAAKLPKDMFIIENGLPKVKYRINCEASLEKLTEENLSGDREKLAKAEFLASLINYISLKYPEISTNTISYDELIQRVCDTLSNSQTLSDKLYEKYPVAFVDEFQDTDKLQWKIFSNIYKIKSGTVRGNLIVVGDPKQAIYRFRGADVDTYIEAREHINNSLSLNTNFRSHPNIINFINKLFKGNGKNKILGNGIDYLESIAAWKENDIIPKAAEVENIAKLKNVSHKFFDEEVQIVAINGKTKIERDNNLLKSMTFEILALLNTNPELKGKIAVLVTKNKEGSDLVEYLRQYGVKSSELKLGNIFATTTANELYLFLTSVYDLSNRKNFMHAISSKLFNLNLSSLSLELGETNLIIQKLSQDFYSYQETWKIKGIISLIYELVDNLYKSGLNVLSNRELANIWQLAELLNGSNVENFAELLFWFKHKIDNSKNGLNENIDGINEELIRLDNDDEQIIITTQHKAKGLEFPILFCPYFKNSYQLDGLFDFNYKRPFFSNYRLDDLSISELVTDKDVGEKIVENDNMESHRLNYVTLTRAKNRIYIYLKEPTKNFKTGEYNANERPDKIVELFGYIKHNTKDTSHLLFNYPDFFGDNPSIAIKDPKILPGVIVYNRVNVSSVELERLHFNENYNTSVSTGLNYVNNDFKIFESFKRQSYSAITHDHDYFSNNDETDLQINKVEYRYTILDDKKLSGATFGLLFHALCENFPFNNETLFNLLCKYNIETTNNDYLLQLPKMIDEAYSFSIIDDLCIKDIRQGMHEMQFNLEINNDVSICVDIGEIINKYFGNNHPFSLACKSLNKIESGFLIGFIDLTFEYNGKYWILDYKTNSLFDYASAKNVHDINNQIIQSMAEHHYYLQYLLYLIAVKRHLEQRLKIEDATNLIGGAVYFYVRGVYTNIDNFDKCIYLDNNCANMINELDKLLKKYKK